MTIVSGCCCWRTLRKGSFASGFYTLILYTITLVGSSAYLFSSTDAINLFTFNWVMLACYPCCIITSVVLIIGLSVESHNLLIPWLVTISSTTILDILLSMSLLTEKVDVLLVVLYLVDFVIWGLNICSFLCVSSQYQVYRSRRNSRLDELNRMSSSSISLEQECWVPCVPLNTELKMVPTDSTSLKSLHSSINSDMQQFQTTGGNEQNGRDLIKIAETCPLPGVFLLMQEK